jgi:DNA-binding transcriptional ArsR family regulator
MDELPDTYNLESIEQLRAVADPLRMRIYQILTLRPMTATQVAEELGEAPPKIHYHVRELERVGLLRQVDSRERNGILEKYFRAIASGLRVPPSLLQQSPPNELAATVSDFFNSVATRFQTAMNRLLADESGMIENNPLTVSQDAVWMTPQEFERTLADALALFKPYYARRGVADEREIALTVIGYVAMLANQASTDASVDAETKRKPNAVTPPAAPRAPFMPAMPQAPSAPHGPAAERGEMRTRKAIVAGAVTYSRRELEDLASRGERLDLIVIGRLSFADDVSAELVEQTIARINLYGVIHASAAAQAVLKSKEVKGTRG